MMSVLDARVMDANASALGTDMAQLMDNAGAELASVLKNRFHGKSFAFFCGHGNNGGDGIAAAGKMDDEDVYVYLIKSRDTLKGHNAELLERLNCPVLSYDGCKKNPDVLVDCALGSGLHGPLKQPYKEYVARTRNFKGHIVSADIPSGLGTGDSVLPDITVTMHEAKYGMTEANSGEIITVDIGMPSKAYMQTGPGDMLRYHIPEQNSHKGSNGRLLIIGGGPYYGAPALAGIAALRTGTDTVKLAVPSSCSDRVAAVSPVFVMTELSEKRLMPEAVNGLLKSASLNDAVLIGPGLGRSPDTAAAVRKFVSECSVPMVVDADGITALGTHVPNMRAPVILTPHAGEYRSLGGTEYTDEGVATIAQKTGCVVVLKGHEDIISDGFHTRRNITGTPGMTGAGTGDVLAGIVAGLLSKGIDSFGAACLGTYISGKAGETSFSRNGYGMIATDIVDDIPSVIMSGLGH